MSPPHKRASATTTPCASRITSRATASDEIDYGGARLPRSDGSGTIFWIGKPHHVENRISIGTPPAHRLADEPADLLADRHQ